MTADIRTDTNLVEVVTVRTRPQVDPEEPIVGTVHIWEANGEIWVYATGIGYVDVSGTAYTSGHLEHGVPE